jgi:hypothetical protein
MVKPKTIEVRPGDRFTKAADSNERVWEVVEVWVAVDGIAHARLKGCDIQGSLITIGAAVLADSNFWRPVRVE